MIQQRQSQSKLEPNRPLVVCLHVFPARPGLLGPTQAAWEPHSVKYSLMNLTRLNRPPARVGVTFWQHVRTRTLGKALLHCTARRVEVGQVNLSVRAGSPLQRSSTYSVNHPPRRNPSPGFIYLLPLPCYLISGGIDEARQNRHTNGVGVFRPVKCVYRMKGVNNVASKCYLLNVLRFNCRHVEFCRLSA